MKIYVVQARDTRKLFVVNFPILHYGMKGKEVQKLQSLLQLSGYYCGKLNGLYDDDTLKAVLICKGKLNMRLNSVVTSRVWQALNK